jgi:hypothetical protein
MSAGGPEFLVEQVEDVRAKKMQADPEARLFRKLLFIHRMVGAGPTSSLRCSSLDAVQHPLHIKPICELSHAPRLRRVLIHRPW